MYYNNSPYLCRFESVEFTNADVATVTINNWASTASNQLIPTIFEKEEILPNMKMIFINIIYFKGWRINYIILLFHSVFRIKRIDFKSIDSMFSKHEIIYKKKRRKYPQIRLI